MIIWKLKLHYVDPKAAVKTKVRIGLEGKLIFPATEAACGPVSDWQLYTINRNKVSCGHCLNKLKKQGGYDGKRYGGNNERSQKIGG